MIDTSLVSGFPPLSVAGRVDRVRDAWPDGVEAFVVTNLTNVRWLTGFTGSNGVLVVGPESLTFVTDGRYSTQAPEQIDDGGSGATVEINQDLVPVAAAALAGVGTIALEADNLTWAGHQRWAAALGGATLVPTEALIVELRSVKDSAELARMEAAAAVTDASLADATSLIVAGSTERQVGLALDDGIRARGATGPGYDTIVASGPNAALPHARPSDRAFQDGDLIVIDVGGLVEGYRSDMTRTFVIGDADDRTREIVALVSRAQAAGVAVAAPGVAVADVDAACRDLITEAGYGEAFSHGTGHGVGLDIHELPSVRGTNSAILQPGQVITVEPGVYLPGYGGVRVEDSVVITAGGCRPLTHSPKLAF